MQRPIIGLALGGGAARGWAHIGVLKALDAAGIQPDIIAGSSMGAIAGGCYAAGKLDVLEDFVRTLTLKSVLQYLDFSFAGSGLIGGGRLHKLLDSRLGTTAIEDLPHVFAAVATQLGTGHEIWLTKGNLVNAMRASSALPGVFKPVCINGRWLTDGVLVNPIPVSVCRSLGAELVIAVNVHTDMMRKAALLPDHGEPGPRCPTPTEYQPPQNEKGNGRAAMRLLHRQFFGAGKNAPGITSVMLDAFNIVQDRIARARLAGDPPDVMIRPAMRDIGLFDFHRGKEAIPRGEEAAKRALEDISLAVGEFLHAAQ